MSATLSGPAFSDYGLLGPVAWTTPPGVDRLASAAAPAQLGKPLVPLKVASPRLDDELFPRLPGYGTPQPTEAGKFGIDPQQAAAQIAEFLPGIIDKLSPNGQLPQGGDVLSQGIDLLKGFLGGR